ncbi:MAG: hypothetical protein IH571_04570, partial [Acholeplasmataceae bacterium]|nr:hypothetical protein [Acholeplasmataceae bacterium]
YERMFIANEDESKKLELNLQSIQVGQMESYLNESFQKMTWIVDMPFLENDYKLEDGFIHLELINLESYVFFIGDMHLIYPKDASNDLNWIGLHGTKKENSFLSRLDAIFVEMDAIAVEIEAVLIGIEHAVTFEISGETLVLRIPYENALLFNVPIIIRYQHQGNVKTQYIENFKYVVDYQILKESGPIIYAYALN